MREGEVTTVAGAKLWREDDCLYIQSENGRIARLTEPQARRLVDALHEILLIGRPGDTVDIDLSEFTILN